MSLSVRCVQTHSMKLGYAQFIGDTVGDVPLISLHRIPTALRLHTINHSLEYEKMLRRRLIAANIEYRERTGNKWNCLTPCDLVAAIDGLEEDIKAINKSNLTHAVLTPGERNAMRTQMAAQTTQLIAATRAWFELWFDEIVYDSKGNIPWAVVLALRKRLSVWVRDTNQDPFGDNVEDFLLEVAASKNIRTDNPEEAWEKMGGKVFKAEE